MSRLTWPETIVVGAICTALALVIRKAPDPDVRVIAGMAWAGVTLFVGLYVGRRL